MVLFQLRESLGRGGMSSTASRSATWRQEVVKFHAHARTSSQGASARTVEQNASMPQAPYAVPTVHGLQTAVAALTHLDTPSVFTYLLLPGEA